MHWQTHYETTVLLGDADQIYGFKTMHIMLLFCASMFCENGGKYAHI